jgi:TP901 family phage tail tape measure protein
MNKSFTVSVLLRAFDYLSGPMRGALRSIEDVDRAAARSKGLRDMARALGDVGEQAQKIGALTMGGGVAGAAALGLTSLPGDALRASHELRQIGNVAELNRAQLRAMNTELLFLAPKVNQTQADLIAGLGILTSKGMGVGDAMQDLPAIGKAATAMTADVRELAETSFAIRQSLFLGKASGGDMARSLEAAAQAGQQGAFELKNMASVFPSLTSYARDLGMRGVPAVAQLGAALQVALLGAGSPDQAANNFQNFLAKVTAPETVRHFKEFGINLEAEMKRISASGDPVLEMVLLIQRATKGDQFKMGQLFGDMQVLSFLRPMLANVEKYKAIRDTSLAGGGLIDRNFNNMMEESVEQWKLLRINAAAVAMPPLLGPLERVNGALTHINRHPLLQRSLVGGIATTIAAGAALVVGGTVLRGGAAALATFARVQHGAALLRAGFMGAAPAGGFVARAIMRIGFEAGRTGPRVAAVNGWLRDMIGWQRAVSAAEFRGGWFELVRFQALRAR